MSDPIRVGGGYWTCAVCKKEFHASEYHQCPAVPSPGPTGTAGEPTWPCTDCGLPRTKAEGGTTFTVCDDCWEKHRTAAAGAAPASPADISLRAALIKAVGLMDEVYRAHRDPSDAHWNECESAPCQWCTEVDEVRAAAKGTP